MPLPKPRTGEKQSAYIGRCMRYVTRKGEFKNRSQRSAVCFSEWRNRSKRYKR